LVDGFWLFNGLWSFNSAFELGLSLTDMFFDELEIFNISDKSISVLVSIIENFFGGSTWNGRLQEFPGVVAEGFELLESHFSFGSFGHFAGSVHDLETHFSTMSLEEEVTLSKRKMLPVI
jgi:hypothetical protein